MNSSLTAQGGFPHFASTWVDDLVPSVFPCHSPRLCTRTLSQEPANDRVAALTAENDALRTRAEHLQGRCLDDLAPVDLCDLINTLTAVSQLSSRDMYRRDASRSTIAETMPQQFHQRVL